MGVSAYWEPGISRPLSDQFSGVLLFPPENRGFDRSSARARPQVRGSKELPLFPEAQEAQSKERGL